MFIVAVLVIALMTAGVLWFINGGSQNGANAPAGSASTTSSGTVPTLVLGTPTSGTVPAGDRSISDGTITLIYPAGDFSVATSAQSIAVHSYIPPCDGDLTYCLYYTGNAYQGTNFDSAGIRVKKRTDLTTQTACLTAPPTGYANFTPTSTIMNNYAVSEFTPIGDAGAGHYSTGTLYRLFYSGSCYEFETRIGQSQFANYPSGTIQQFATTDEAALQSEMQTILSSVTLPSGETVVFPQ